MVQLIQLKEKGGWLWLQINRMVIITGRGVVRDRSQVHNPHNDRWIKRDADTGRFIDQKADKEPFKGVRKEK